MNGDDGVNKNTTDARRTRERTVKICIRGKKTKKASFYALALSRVEVSLGGKSWESENWIGMSREKLS